jgi:hypothetical protein
MFATGHRGSRSVSPLLPFFILSILVLIAASPALGGKTVKIDGVLHVQNGDTPSEGRETLTLEEVWRVGGDDEEGLLLAMVPEVCGDEEGNIYVMDAKLCQVHVFSPEGELLRTVFRQGEGPGETLRPRDLVITKDGIGLAEEFPAKIIMVDRSGLPMENVRPASTDEAGGNMGTLIAADFGGGNLVLSGTEISQSDTPGVQDRINFLASYSRAGKERARYCEAKTYYDFNNMKFIEREHTPSFWWGFTVDRSGNVYVAADRDAYAISVFTPDGTLDRVIERTFEPYTRTDTEKKRMYDLINSAIGDAPFEFELNVEDNEPVIDFFHHGLRVDDDGNLWVTTSRGLRDQTGGAMLTYDVFDPDGHFSKQVAIVCDGNSYYDCLFWVSKDQVVLVTGAMAALAAQFGGGAALDSDDEEATPQEIICYNVKRGRKTN